MVFSDLITVDVTVSVAVSLMIALKIVQTHELRQTLKSRLTKSCARDRISSAKPAHPLSVAPTNLGPFYRVYLRI